MYLESTRGLYIVAATLSGFALKNLWREYHRTEKEESPALVTVILVSCTEENVL